MLDGTDESSYQSTNTPAGAFFGVKVSQGTSYLNPKYRDQLASGRAKGELPIHYCFLVPGNPIAQARYFVAHADIKPGDLLACDWETAGVSEADRDRFIHEVKALLPHNKVGLYCSLSWWQGSREKFYGDFLWVADYTYRKGFVVPCATFDQYSDKPVDQDVARFNSDAAMRAWAHALDAKKPVAKKTVPPMQPAKPAHPVIQTARIDLHKALTNHPKPGPIRRALAAALRAIRGIR